jgi:hypothetical protein
MQNFGRNCEGERWYGKLSRRMEDDFGVHNKYSLINIAQVGSP